MLVHVCDYCVCVRVSTAKTPTCVSVCMRARACVHAASRPSSTISGDGTAPDFRLRCMRHAAATASHVCVRKRAARPACNRRAPRPSPVLLRLLLPWRSPRVRSRQSSFGRRLDIPPNLGLRLAALAQISSRLHVSGGQALRARGPCGPRLGGGRRDGRRADRPSARRLVQGRIGEAGTPGGLPLRRCPAEARAGEGPGATPRGRIRGGLFGLWCVCMHLYVCAPMHRGHLSILAVAGRMQCVHACASMLVSRSACRVPVCLYALGRAHVSLAAS
jgi:hypothetical protein